MAGFFDNLRQVAGNAVDLLGTYTPISQLGDMGISESIAGQKPTINTGTTYNATINPFQGNYAAPVQQPTPVSNSSGQVMGATTTAPGLPTGTGGGIGGGTGQPSQGFLNSLLQQAGQGIQQQYEGTLGQLQSNADFLGQQSSDLINQAGTVYDQQVKGFDSQRQSAQKDLDRSQSQIDTNRSDALSDLTSDLRSQMESFTRMVGALGAGDSSATGMGQYAFGRLGQQARSDIWKQANQLSSEVGVRREKVNSLYQDNLRQLGDWKVNQLDAIQNDFKVKMQKIEQDKLSADQTRLAQLNDIQMQIQQQAMTTALQVDQRVSQVAAANQQWAKMQAQNLNSMQAQLQQSLQALNLGAVQADPMQSTAVQNTFNYTPQSLATQNAGATQVALPTNRKDDKNK